MLFAIPSASFGCINAMLHQTFLFLGQLWQLFEVSQILEFFTVCKIIIVIVLVNALGALQEIMTAGQGPVVQSIVSLTSSLRGQLVKCFTTL